MSCKNRTALFTKKNNSQKHFLWKDKWDVKSQLWDNFMFCWLLYESCQATTSNHWITTEFVKRAQEISQTKNHLEFSVKSDEKSFHKLRAQKFKLWSEILKRPNGNQWWKAFFLVRMQLFCLQLEASCLQLSFFAYSRLGALLLTVWAFLVTGRVSWPATVEFLCLQWEKYV